MKHFLKNFQHEEIFEIIWTDNECKSSSSDSESAEAPEDRVAFHVHALKESKTIIEGKNQDKASMSSDKKKSVT